MLRSTAVHFPGRSQQPCIEEIIHSRAILRHFRSADRVVRSEEVPSHCDLAAPLCDGRGRPASWRGTA